jgi:ubiquinone/menaquinone biosynthesis C-methylase UbiE
MRRALDAHWRTFASSLPDEATVLDIGCGAGAVGRELLSWRSDLSITGIDFASILPSRERRNQLLPDTPMESLPFADRRFRGVVSQFGYEYGKSAQAAREIARVVVPDGQLSLLVHHQDSPIVIDSDRNLRAMEQLTGARLQAAFMSGSPAELEQQLFSIRRDCPGERIVEQAAEGLHRRINGDAAERAQVWRALVDALAPELVMAKSLQAACVAPDDLAEWLSPLIDGFELMPPSTLRMSGKPLAWKIEGRRR